MNVNYHEELLERALKEAFSIPCGSSEAASSIRQDLYNFRNKTEVDGRYSGISFKLHGQHLIMGPADQIEHVWAKLP